MRPCACGDYDEAMQSANKFDHIVNWTYQNYLPVFHIRMVTRVTGSRICLLCGGINRVTWVVTNAPVIADHFSIRSIEVVSCVSPFIATSR